MRAGREGRRRAVPTRGRVHQLPPRQERIAHLRVCGRDDAEGVHAADGRLGLGAGVQHVHAILHPHRVDLLLHAEPGLPGQHGSSRQFTACGGTRGRQQAAGPAATGGGDRRPGDRDPERANRCCRRAAGTAPGAAPGARGAEWAAAGADCVLCTGGERPGRPGRAVAHRARGAEEGHDGAELERQKVPPPPRHTPTRAAARTLHVCIHAARALCAACLAVSIGCWACRTRC